MVVLVTGGSGQLGQALQSIAAKHPGIAFYFAASSQVNIADKNNLEQIFQKINPKYCINAAAYTAVDKAESEPEQAFLINTLGAKNLAETCLKFHTTLIHISTDFVFDGNQIEPYCEEDQTNPEGIYGKTKRDGEVAIASVFEQYYIIRTSWLYSEFGNNFMKTMLRLGAEKTSLNVVNDQIGTPTYAVDLAEAIVAMIQSKKEIYGIYHFSNEGKASWYDFAKEIFDLNGMTINLHPIPTSAYPTPAKRPKYSVLCKEKIKRTFGIEINDWKVSLAGIKKG